MDSDSIALYFLNKLNSTDCSMWVLERLDFFKWHDVINSNSWFLAILKEFSDLTLFKLIFFLKLTLNRILTKTDVSCVKS